MTTVTLAIFFAVVVLSSIVESSPNIFESDSNKEVPATSESPSKEVHVIRDHLDKSIPDIELDLEKRSRMNDDWKRAPQAKYIQALENSLGSMQRPRFGKRFDPYDAISDDAAFYNEKRAKSLLDMENALSSMQRPRFGRSAVESKELRSSKR